MSARLRESTLNVGGFLDEFEKDQVKRDVDILLLFSSFGVKLEKKGNSYMGLCPFHDDKNPSLSVDKGKGLFHCFGCGASGDVFDLVMRMRSIPFREALEYLKKSEFTPFVDAVSPKGDASVQQPAEALPESEEPGPGASGESVLDTDSLGCSEEPSFQEQSPIDLNRVAGFYQTQLIKNPEAVKYLENRSLLDWKLLTRLKVGYAPGNLKEKLGERHYQLLKEAGVFTEKGKEAFAGCITFPLYDGHDRIVGLYGRRINPRAKVKHLYLKGPLSGLFNHKAYSVYKERMILTESVIDALSLMVMGLGNVSCLYGTNGATSALFRILKESRTKEVVLAFDNDEAGRKAAEEQKKKFLDAGMTVRIILPPEITEKGLLEADWNEVLQTSPLDKGSLEQLINKAQQFTPEKEKGSLAAGMTIKQEGGKYYFTFGEITYRLIGVKEGFVSSLRVNVRAERGEEKHIDNVDLFSARSRSSFSLVLGRLFRVEAARIDKDLIGMLEWLEEDRDRKMLGLDSVESSISLTPEEEALGLDLLKDPDFFDRIEADLSALGYVGEGPNKRLMYLAASSRKLADPISLIVISQSAAGKSYLIDTVKKLIPPEDVLSMTSLSDQALNYLPEEALLHKFLIMGEAVHSDVVDHQMREMLSAQELSRLVTTKDEKTGKMTSKLVRKKAVVSAVMSSATGDINPENASRCFVISTDESEEQTRAIHREQRRKYSLERIEEKKESVPGIIKAHHTAQRLLKDVMIINPFADLLDFPASLMRSRRDHERFMDLIAVVCYLRQYQKGAGTPSSQPHIECDIEDYRIAHGIMMSILPSTLSNFPKSAQLLYGKLRELIRARAEEEGLSFNEVSLTQREMREKTGLSHDVIKWNLRILVEYEYVRKTGGLRRGQSGHYRIDRDEDIQTLLSGGIPSPEELSRKLSGVKWGNKSSTP